MKYLKVFIALLLIAELTVFTIFLRGVFMDPEKEAEVKDGIRVPVKLSELSEDYRIYKLISQLAFHKSYKLVSFPKGTVNVYINGDYLPTDSLFLDSLMLQLNNLMEICHFKWGSDDQKGYSIKFKFRNSQYRYQDDTILEEYKKGRVILYLYMPDSITQIQRNKYIKSKISHDYFHIRLDDYIIKKYNFQSDSIIPSNNWLLAEFNEIEKQILKRIFIKHRYIKFFLKYPVLYVHYLKRIGNSPISILYSLNSFLLIGLYFMFLISRGKLVYSRRSWKQFNKQVLFVCFAFLLLLFLQSIYSIDPAVAMFFEKPIAFMLFLFALIICFILANIIFYIEGLIDRLQIDKNLKLLLKIISSFIITILPIIILFNIYPYSSHIEWILFIIFILGVRAMLIYQNYLIENAVKEKDLELAQLKAVQQQSELQAIHSRINPHFLYNSLNSIASLSAISPEKTEKMALSLSRFFRFAINKGNEEFVKVKDELEIVETYLEIEKIRFGEKLQYNINCEEEVKEKAIPRFIIQPLVENAVKHGVSNITEEGRIEVELKMAGEFLAIKVSDNGKDFPEEPLYGYGLQSIYDKLKLYYKGEARIELNKSPNKAIDLYLPLTKSKEE